MIELKKLTKTYDRQVLKGVSYVFEKNKIYVVKGVSGCGKTTLLNILGGLDEDYEGEYYFEGVEVRECDIKDRQKYRERFGYVFQSSLLMSGLTVLDNLLYVCDDEKLIREYADVLDVRDLLDSYPEQLSGGERQRISVIRALIMHPDVLLADEPTASLDNENSQELAELIASLRSESRTIIVSTHEDCFDELADEIIHLEYGVIRAVEHKKIENDKGQTFAEREKNRKGKRNSLKNSIMLMLKRNKAKWYISALLPMIFIITALLSGFSLQYNFEEEAVKYSMKKYPMEVISAYDMLVGEITAKYDEAQVFELYTIEMDAYECYPLLDREDSVLAYGNLIQYGAFPDGNREVLVSYPMAEYLTEKGDVKNCIGQKIMIKDIEYTVTGIVADMSDESNTEIDSEIYQGDCYYKEAGQERLVYMAYDIIAEQGKLQKTLKQMIKIPGLYDDSEMYDDVKNNIIGTTISIWDERIYDAQSLITLINKLVLLAFVIVATMALVFIKNDIAVDLFYRRKELGYLQIFGVKRKTIITQLVVERMVKSKLSTFIAIAVFHILAVLVKIITGIDAFVPIWCIVALCLVMIIFSFISVIMPIRKFMKKSVLSLITNS